MRRRVMNSVAAVTALLATAGCGGAAGRARADSAPTKAAPRRAPIVMFLGDSYTTGRLGQVPELTYAADTARTLGWQVILGGYRGTGFVAVGSVHKNFADLFTEQLAWRPAPDLVIVSGGHNDRNHPPATVAGAARQLLTTIRQTWPDTRMLLMGPLWGSGDPTPKVERIRDELANVASEQNVPFVDPLRERWITGDRVQGTGNAPLYILSDGVHPSTAGARYIAGRFVADLRALKLAKP
ncbi:SGNH/GDSL hydrolase family protein [Actinoallomurus iriomotensis]|nr:SGNH/GDSL hydrolase family protein [Actinoallomurus iriomotensis]